MDANLSAILPLNNVTFRKCLHEGKGIVPDATPGELTNMISEYGHRFGRKAPFTKILLSSHRRDELS